MYVRFSPLYYPGNIAAARFSGFPYKGGLEAKGLFAFSGAMMGLGAEARP
jgi:hypothetical protein